MNEDIVMLQAIERYLDGTMLPDEKAYFEQIRKNTPEIDQMVVEHSMFLHQMDMYSANRNFKHLLHETHNKLVSTGDINEGTVVTTKGRVIQLYNKYKRVTAIAACVGGAIAIVMSSLFFYFSPSASNNQIQQLSREFTNFRTTFNSTVNEVKSKLPVNPKWVSGGTGFLIDGKGYIVTNAHVLKGSGATVVNNNGEEFNAKIVHIDAAKDLAILKIEDEDYKPLKSLPYTINKTGADLGDEIFTLGYPRNDITYTHGYLSAKTGFHGDSLSYQIQMNSNPGNSGGPVLNKEGEVIGVLSTRQTQADEITFAIKSKNIYSLVDDLKKDDTSMQKVKLPVTVKGKAQESSIRKIEDCVFLVKAYNSTK